MLSRPWLPPGPASCKQTLTAGKRKDLRCAKPKNRHRVGLLIQSLRLPQQRDLIGVAHDIDRAAVAQQVIEFRVIRKFIDPFEVDFQKLTSHRGPNPDAVKEDILFPVVGPHTDDIAGELGEECG